MPRSALHLANRFLLLSSAWLLLSVVLPLSGCSEPIEYGPAEQGAESAQPEGGQPESPEPEAIAPPPADEPEISGMPLPGSLMDAPPKEYPAEDPTLNGPSEGPIPGSEPASGGSDPASSPLPRELMGDTPADVEPDRTDSPSTDGAQDGTGNALDELFGLSGEDESQQEEENQDGQETDTAESAFGDFLMGGSSADSPPEDTDPEPQQSPEPQPEPEPVAEEAEEQPLLPPLPAPEETVTPQAPTADDSAESVPDWSPERPASLPEPVGPGPLPEPRPAPPSRAGTMRPKRPTLDINNTRHLAWMLGAKLSLTLANDAEVEAWEPNAIAQMLGLRGAKVDSTGSLPARAARLLKTAGELGSQLAKEQTPAHAALFEIAVKANVIAAVYETHPKLAPRVAAAIEAAAARAGVDGSLCTPLIEKLRSNAPPDQIRSAAFQLHDAMQAALLAD